MKRFYQSKQILYSLIGVGVVLRLFHYLANRSLWVDEAMLANNIVSRSFWQFLEPLDCNQYASFGFLVVEKLNVLLFGNTEYALRAFPLLAGILSLFLFYKVAKHFISPSAIPIALGLFVVSDRLVYYSSEVKP